MLSTVDFYSGGDTLISLDYRSGQPLHRQVVEGYKRLILGGVIGEDEKLPSVRDLASGLAINPNTIARAYRELEVEGFIGSSPGKGVYVLGSDALKERKLEEIYTTIDTGIHSLLDFGCELEDILSNITARARQEEAR